MTNPRRMVILLGGLLLALARFGAGAAPPIQVSAGDLALALDQTRDGIRVVSLVDTRSGESLFSADPLPLFSLTLQRVGATNQVALTAASGWRQCAIQHRGSRWELSWLEPLDRGLAGVGVTVVLSADARAQALRWQLRVNNHSTNWSAWRVVFPQVALADLGTNGSVLFARGPGEVQSGVWGRRFSYQGNYPSGWCSFQFLAAYREGPAPTGLYLGIHDPWGGAKDVAVESDPAAHLVRMKFDHPAPDMSRPSNGFALEGEAVWQLLRGDWYDAAQIYRSWAQRHARWWPRLGRDGRTDTPQWFRELDAWAMARGGPERCVDAIKGFRDFLGVPAGFHWYDWHQIPFDNDYPHYFPTKTGFAEGVAELKAAGVFVMPYINGRLWDSLDRGSEDYQFGRVAKPCVTKQPDGQPYLETYESKETNKEPVRLGVMCPATPLWRNTVSNIVLRLLRECGNNGVYIDQVAAAAPKLCMDSSHGHPLGGGHWWNEGYWRMLEDIRRAMPPGTMLTTECNAEPFVRWFDGYLTWHFQYQGQVPIFSAIYGGTVQMFGRAYRGGDTKALALRMKAGQQLVFGEQLGWLDPAMMKEKENGDFFRRLVGMRAKIHRYFAAGQMVRPPRFLDPVPTVTADWQWSGKWPITTDAVLTGAWRLPGEKRMVLLFVNVSDTTVSARFRFDPKDNGIRTRDLKLRITALDGTATAWQKEAASFERSLPLAPRSAEAWELAW